MVVMTPNSMRGTRQPIHVHLLTESGMKESQQVGETSGLLPLKEADGE